MASHGPRPPQAAPLGWADVAALTVLEHPLAGALLTRLRDRSTGPAEYRALTRRLGLLLVAEATRDLAVETDTVETPLETYDGSRLARGLVAIPVLRAGLGLLEAVVDLYPDAVVGYLGMERDEITHLPRDYYAKLPPMDGPARAGGGPDARHRRVRQRGRPLREGGRRRRHRVHVRGGGARGPRAHAGRPPRRADRGRRRSTAS